ncbi:AI-2E family transporter [Actinomycetospora succinea]|nr:AI-2E family transporter [Actinomycetospora succinea]
MGEAAMVTATVIGVAALAVAAYAARGALILVFVGFFLATGIEPAVRYLGQRRVPRGAAVALVVLGVLLVLTGVVAVIVVPAAHQVGVLAQQLPDRMNQLGAQVGGQGTSLGAALQDPAQHQQLQQQASSVGKAVGAALTVVFSALGAVLGGVFSAVTVLALMVYFALAMPRILAGLNRTLAREDRIKTADQALGRIGGYVSGQLLVSLVAGLTSLVFFLLAGLPYPALLALVVAILDAIPQVGAALASLAGIGVALTVSPGLAVATLAFFVVYQAVENYLVAPRVFARTVELSPAAAFVALLIGGSVGGLLGAITALPLTAAGKVVLRQALQERRAARPRRPSDPGGAPLSTDT